MKPEYFILTGNGLIDLIDPEPHHFDVEEIALVLSRKPRFGGHGLRDRTPINVAQHSVYVSKHFDDPVIAMLALFHDAQEVASGDVSSPMKELVRDGLGAFSHIDLVEDNAQKQVFVMIGIETGITLPGMHDAITGISDFACRDIPGLPVPATRIIGGDPVFDLSPYDIIHPIDRACAAAEALYLFGENRREEIIECFGMPTDKIEVTPMTQWESEQAFLNRFEYLRSKLESLQSTRATLTT